MLTISDIKNINFRKANLGGYRPDDVDTFIDEVQTSYDQLLKENAELLRKLEILAKKVEEYRSEEDSIRNALMSAQKVGDASIREAKHKSEVIIKDANMKAEKLIANAQREVAKQQAIMERLQRDVASFRSRLLSIYKEHLTLIDALPSEDVLRAQKEAARKAEQVSAQPETAEEESEPETAPEQEEYTDISEQEPENAPVEEPETESYTQPPVQQAYAPQPQPQPVRPFTAQPPFGQQPSYPQPAYNQQPPVQRPVTQQQQTDIEYQQPKRPGGFVVNLSSFEEEENGENKPEAQFGNLQFGDDYDISGDDGEAPAGIFRRR